MSCDRPRCSRRSTGAIVCARAALPRTRSTSRHTPTFQCRRRSWVDRDEVYEVNYPTGVILGGGGERCARPYRPNVPTKIAFARVTDGTSPYRDIFTLSLQYSHAIGGKIYSLCWTYSCSLTHSTISGWVYSMALISLIGIIKGFQRINNYLQRTGGHQ